MHLLKNLLIINYALLITFSSCSVSKQLSKSADKILLKDSVISTGHIGISIYEPATNSYWYNYEAAKYFVPASNVKLFTCYAGMKYLGDSLTGIIYQDFDTAILITPTGDPSFLHPDFIKQPVLDFLQKEKRKLYIHQANWKDKALGNGWAWDDYNEPYMAERNALPIYGNVAAYKVHIGAHYFLEAELISETFPDYFKQFIDSFYVVPFKITHSYIKDSSGLAETISKFGLKRKISNNNINAYYKGTVFSSTKIPFYTDGINTAIQILNYSYHLNIKNKNLSIDESLKSDLPKSFWRQKIKSQPTDSLLKPMMHRSDNFFAEQTLLMVSNEYLGYMNDEAIIDTLLKTDFKDVPQKTQWVDGCGLSRYNLFTPQSFIYILNKMKIDFGLERLKVILPTGGEGTLKNYYLKDSGYIYAKTGSLSNNTALSGFLITKKDKLLIFSILVNNFQGSASAARIAIESFIEKIRGQY